MLKKFGLGLIGLLIAGALVAGLTGIKLDQFKTMGEAGAKHVMPATPVNSFTAKEIDWAPELLAVGSVVAIKGTTITSEIEGTVTAIYFTPGGNIEKDQPLIKLNASVEEAQLNEAEVAAKWARIAFERAKELSKTRNISRAELDTAETNISQADAKVAYYKAIIAKKTLYAPFSGKLGISQIRIGEFITKGRPIVSLQSLSPIFVHFSLPQQNLRDMKEELSVMVTSDAYPAMEFEGKISAMNPDIDPLTRTVRVQATLKNENEQLRPGMFVSVKIDLGRQEQRLVIPATAVLYGPYGDSVFTIEETSAEEGGKKTLSIQPKLVRLGEKRGDFVTILQGVQAGEQVVSTGSFKLRANMPVVIDNSLAPEFKLNPMPANN